MYLWLEAMEEEYRESRLPPFIYRLDLVVLDEDVGGWTAAPVVMVKFNFYGGISDSYTYISWKLISLLKFEKKWTLNCYSVQSMTDNFAWFFRMGNIFVIIVDHNFAIWVISFRSICAHHLISRATFSHLKIIW